MERTFVIPERPVLVLHYHEIGLKGGNRDFFERRLKRNVEAVLRSLGAPNVKRLRGRMLVRSMRPEHVPEALTRLQKVFGLATISVAAEVEPTLDALAVAAVAQARVHPPAETFAVRAKRAEKHYPFTSQDIGREVGAAVAEVTGWRVDLSSPDVEVFVEVAQQRGLVYIGKVRGPGGLPVGTAGRAVSLFSAGLDSPVATWRMMKRGLHIHLVHFHSQPFMDRASEEKSRRLADLLADWHGPLKLTIVPFIEAQQAIIAYTPEKLRTILYRRFMLRIAEAIARDEKAKALITGESLGQVASQTLENLAAIEDAATMPVLRPLIGMDKQEIIDEAQRIGTFDISILPQDDACTLLEPKRVETRAKLHEVRRAESALDVQALVDAVLAQIQTEVHYPSWWHEPLPQETTTG
nr:tRNA uracil 4-sulfurtransferase ThiI [Ardenticatena sp.]